MNRHGSAAASLGGGLLGILLLTQPAAAEQFQIRITNVSPNVLSPAPFITHDAGFDLFTENMAASSAIEAIAETGNTAGIVSMAQAALGGSVSDYAVAGAAPMTQGQSAMITINTDMAHPWLSFASMMGISNDGFIGRATGDGAINLFPGGVPLNTTLTIMPAEVWDAGTEVNDESMATIGFLGGMGGVDENGVITKPHPGILGIGDLSTMYNWTGGPVATIEITPEPATMLTCLAMGGVLLRRRRRNQAVN